MRARRDDVTLTWKKLPEGTVPSRVIGGELDMSNPAEVARGVIMPVQVNAPPTTTIVHSDCAGMEVTPLGTLTPVGAG